MYYNEETVLNSVIALFGINRRKKYAFEAFFREIECLQDSGIFLDGQYYHLWIGSIEQDGVKKHFVGWIDLDPQSIEPEMFDFENSYEPASFFGSDNRFYSLIYRADAKVAVIPSWWLDMIAVKKHLLLNKKFKNYERYSSDIKGVFEHINTGEEVFFSWVFYYKGNMLDVFNIETGREYHLGKVLTRIPIKNSVCRIKDMQLFCEKNVIQHNKKRDLSDSFE